MSETELKILRLHAPLRYTAVPTAGGRPFIPRDTASDGAEDAALYDPDSIVRLDPLDGPRACTVLPEPAAAGRSPETGPDVLNLEPGVYGFLQGAADTPEAWLNLVESFARQAWWESLDCEGPYILRRVREDGTWAAQVWRKRVEE